MDKIKLKLDWATHRAAKYACENWHYSKCHPSTLQKAFRVGIWENDNFIGVIIFGHGANLSIGKPYNLTIYEVCELTRIALKKHMTPVSKMISIALKFLTKKNPKLKLVVSYADTGQNHSGIIYQATNWVYVGISKGVPRIKYNGKEYHMKGFRTSYKNIPMSDKRIEKIKGTDKHKYLMPLDKEMKIQIEPLRKPYPKRDKQAIVSDQENSGGATPTITLQNSTKD